MRYAVFTSSANGLILADKIRNNMSAVVDIYCHENMPAREDVHSYSRLSTLLKDIFNKYSGLIFIMATGIVVRTIAPLLESKLTDPAVVVMDEKGQNIISLLSGHVGGANDLTLKLARKLGGNPVITTATDINYLVAPDVVASKLGLYPVSKEGIQVLNSALLRGETVEYFVDEETPCSRSYITKLRKNAITAHLYSKAELERVIKTTKGYKAIITKHSLPADESVLYLKPRKLVAGIGCRKGTSSVLIMKALTSACGAIGWGPERVDELASSVVKANEQGLLSVGKKLNKQVSFCENDALEKQIEAYGLQESSFVKQTIGVGNVSEAAAYCCVAHGVLALPKTKYEKVAVALVWEK